jgi:hypothetical protein
MWNYLYVFDVFVRGQVSGWQFGTAAELTDAGVTQATVVSLSGKIFNYLAIYKFFVAYPNALIWIPIILGLLVIIYDFKKGRLPVHFKVLLLIFIYLFFMWGWTGFLVGGDTYRYLIPLGIFASFFVAYHFGSFPKISFKINNYNSLKCQFQFCLISLSAIFAYFVVESVHPSNLLYSNIVNTKIVASSIEMLVFLLFFAPYLLQTISNICPKIKTKFSQKISVQDKFKISKRKFISVLFVLAIIINLIFPVFLICRSSSIISEVSWDPAFYAQPDSIEATEHTPWWMSRTSICMILMILH